MALFEAGPWDNAAAVDGAHIFSKKRKLLYGDEHNDAAHNEDGAEFAPKELHKMHGIWRKGALKMMQELANRTKGEVRLKKEVARGQPNGAWPGDLAKHHYLIEEMIELGVVSLHQDDHAHVFAIVHRGKLGEAVQKFIKAPAAAAATTTTTTAATAATTAAQDAAAAAAAAATVPYFTSSPTFTGAMAGCVFKNGEKGVGYYRDGPKDTAASASTTGGTATPPLPDGWVEGVSPEGYTYYVPQLDIEPKTFRQFVPGVPCGVAPTHRLLLPRVGPSHPLDCDRARPHSRRLPVAHSDQH